MNQRQQKEPWCLPLGSKVHLILRKKDIPAQKPGCGSWVWMTSAAVTLEEHSAPIVAEMQHGSQLRRSRASKNFNFKHVIRTNKCKMRSRGGELPHAISQEHRAEPSQIKRAPTPDEDTAQREHRTEVRQH